MSKHTPGFWDYHTAPGGEVPHIAIYKANIPGDEGYEIERIADVYGTPLNEANAQLITAAPDLLAVVQRFYDYMAFCADNSEAENDLVEAARAAIAKAGVEL